MATAISRRDRRQTAVSGDAESIGQFAGKFRKGQEEHSFFVQKWGKKSWELKEEAKGVIK